MRRSWRSSYRERVSDYNRQKRERDRMARQAKGKAGHRQCGRKRRYPDEISAMVAAQTRMSLSSVDLRTYKCDICGGWHLTHVKRGGRH